jgi:hypothetical protein
MGRGKVVYMPCELIVSHAALENWYRGGRTGIKIWLRMYVPFKIVEIGSGKRSLLGEGVF